MILPVHSDPRNPILVNNRDASGTEHSRDLHASQEMADVFRKFSILDLLFISMPNPFKPT